MAKEKGVRERERKKESLRGNKKLYFNDIVK